MIQTTYRTRGLAACVAAAWLICLAGPSSVRAQDLYELINGDFELVDAPDPATPAGRLQMVRVALADKKTKQAIKLADRWIKDHPNHPLLPTAYMLRGDAKALRGNYFKSLFDYEYVVRMYPESELFNDVLEREFRVAQLFARGTKRKLWGMRIVPAYGESEELYIRIQERSPGSQLAERSGVELADQYYARAEMGLASEAYDLFLTNHPRSAYRGHAMKRQIEASLATFKGPKFDATGLYEAGRRIEDYTEEFPAGAEEMGAEELAIRIDESIAAKTLDAALWYERQSKVVSAEFMFKRVIKDHPSSLAAQTALEHLAMLDPETFGPVEPEIPEVLEQDTEQDTELEGETTTEQIMDRIEHIDPLYEDEPESQDTGSELEEFLDAREAPVDVLRGAETDQE